MIYSIGEVNQRMARLLPNFSVGYDIYDTCGDVSFAIRATLQLQSENSEGCFVPEGYPSPLVEPEIKAVIGENYSEVSTVVARILALSSVAQVCFLCFWFCNLFWIHNKSPTSPNRLVIRQLVSNSAGSWSSPLFCEQYRVMSIRQRPSLDWWSCLTGKQWLL